MELTFVGPYTVGLIANALVIIGLSITLPIIIKDTPHFYPVLYTDIFMIVIGIAMGIFYGIISYGTDQPNRNIIQLNWNIIQPNWDIIQPNWNIIQPN